jgi:hypothetical protein
MIPFAFGEKLMTRLTLDLTTKQINLLFKALESLEEHNNYFSGEIIELVRYLDKKVFPEWENK